jgi:hypothetical protein
MPGLLFVWLVSHFAGCKHDPTADRLINRVLGASPSPPETSDNWVPAPTPAGAVSFQQPRSPIVCCVSARISLALGSFQLTGRKSYGHMPTLGRQGGVQSGVSGMEGERQSDLREALTGELECLRKLINSRTSKRVAVPFECSVRSSPRPEWGSRPTSMRRDAGSVSAEP